MAIRIKPLTETLAKVSLDTKASLELCETLADTNCIIDAAIDLSSQNDALIVQRSVTVSWDAVVTTVKTTIDTITARNIDNANFNLISAVELAKISHEYMSYADTLKVIEAGLLDSASHKQQCKAPTVVTKFVVVASYVTKLTDLLRSKGYLVEVSEQMWGDKVKISVRW